MATQLPHERLEVYQKAAALYEPVRQIITRVRQPHSHLADQVLRAASSVPLNIAEGASEFSRGDKIRFYRMALRSAGETAAVLDLLERSRLVDSEASGVIRRELGHIMAMLTRLIHSHSRR
jgi:four helix bundle protein